uniref:Malate dehydrogenase n=1 Tax=Plectus sambesii TaxID=2011161 RepID=A0A914WBF9_9BILA
MAFAATLLAKKCRSLPQSLANSTNIDIRTAVEIADRKNDSVPKSWGVDSSGIESTDPQKILHGGGLLPVGGAEATGGYKGYGLSAMVEIFCGILGGAHYGPNVRKWMDTSVEADLGQCFIAIDPEAFAPGFAERMQDLITTLRNLPQTTEAAGDVLVPGDPEAEHLKLCDRLGGIPYHPNQIEFAKNLATTLGVPEMKVKS